MKYVYEIFKDDADGFSAIVMNPFGDQVFRIVDKSIFRSGTMSNENDVAGLEKYLKKISVIQEHDTLTSFADAEKFDLVAEEASGRFRKGGQPETAFDWSILRMLNEYEPVFGYEKKEKAYHTNEDANTKEKSYFIDFIISPKLLSNLAHVSGNVKNTFLEDIVENFKLFGYGKGFNSLIYDVIIDKEPHTIPNIITFKAIKI